MWNTEAGTFLPDCLNCLQGLMAVEFSDTPIEEYHIEARIKRWTTYATIRLTYISQHS
ncbi:hypothetical protein RHMOL_Rhmol02G0216400 [Rhododendron molle]|uniref:Uncharacterized protein n=1 Tax=Rhododendron molle TaxID=49168 RepID=A0ACC0PU96_RHOML|nr:hypothetical protein RHMOL_Rhmol02G0216400 [Rhododendron molle]